MAGNWWDRPTGSMGGGNSSGREMNPPPSYGGGWDQQWGGGGYGGYDNGYGGGASGYGGNDYSGFGSGMANRMSNRSGRRAGRANRRGDAFDRWGMDRLSDRSRNREERLSNRSKFFDNWYPGKRIWEGRPGGGEGGGLGGGEGPPPGDGSGMSDFRDKFRYMPYEDDILNVQKQYEQLANRNVNQTGWMDPQSMAGTYFGAGSNEESALGNLNQLAQQQMMGEGGYGGDILRLRQKISQQDEAMKTPLQRAIEDQGLAAMGGGLTAASQATYDTRAAQFDRQEYEARDKLQEGLGSNYSLWGSRRLDEEGDLSARMGEQKNALMADLMQSDAQAAQQYAMQDKQLQNAALGIATNIFGVGSQQALNANNQMLSHTEEMGRQMMEQTKMQMEEGMYNMDNQYKNAAARGDMSQWKNEFDINQRDSMMNNLTGFIEMLFPQGIFPEGILGKGPGPGIGGGGGGLMELIGGIYPQIGGG